MCAGENLWRVRAGERVQVSMGVCDSVHPSVCALLPAAECLYLRPSSSCVNILLNKLRALVNDCH